MAGREIHPPRTERRHRSVLGADDRRLQELRELDERVHAGLRASGAIGDEHGALGADEQFRKLEDGAGVGGGG